MKLLSKNKLSDKLIAEEFETCELKVHDNLNKYCGEETSYFHYFLTDMEKHKYIAIVDIALKVKDTNITINAGEVICVLPKQLRGLNYTYAKGEEIYYIKDGKIIFTEAVIDNITGEVTASVDIAGDANCISVYLKAYRGSLHEREE